MSAKITTVYESIVEFYKTVIGPVVVESLRLLPDSMVLGTAIFTMLSGCISYAVLLFTMVELMLGQRVFSMVISGIAPIQGGTAYKQEVCQPGLSFPNTMRISLLEKIGTVSMFPSPTMFFLTGIISYIVACIQNFSREIKTLGGNLSTRTTISAVMSSIFIFVILMFRYTYECESFSSLIVSLILGLVAGIAIMYQNLALFGSSGINILNLPIIQPIGQGAPMFVCASG